MNDDLSTAPERRRDLALRLDSPRLPRPHDDAALTRGFDSLAERIDSLPPEAFAKGEDAASLRSVLLNAQGRELLASIFANSPFLSACLVAEPVFAAKLLTEGPASSLADILTETRALGCTRDEAALRSGLRRAKRRAALLIALADVSETWDLAAVTGALSDFAETALDAALAHLLTKAASAGEIALADESAPTRGCGYSVLALGKLGARELNYSSDIDLIVVYDPEAVDYQGRRSVQDFAVRLTRDLVRLMEERTAEGYVFRCDLRLRPDPSATPLAISIGAAETYYESLGQNWERAAMIKARAVAGDLVLGGAFIESLRPFVWRKHLDFWAIQDVHSIKRQIYAHKGGAAIAVEGHNIKLGRGGIREIEFFCQTQQLIWGGRDISLRSSVTLEALDALCEAGQVAARARDDLAAAYVFLRTLEHRLQMVNDQQTQVLPDSAEGVAELAAFMGYDRAEDFREELVGHLTRVEEHYAELFEEAPSLSGPGNLVFTGGEPEAPTLQTLGEMGFQDGERVFHTVANWHRGRYRATRSRRAREILTELVPTLLQQLAETGEPDGALVRFDEFLAALPAGVQVFSLLHANPRLLGLLAAIMGGAPALAATLNRRPQLLDAVLTQGFFEALPEAEQLRTELAEAMIDARDFQDALDASRRWANDRRFQAGVHLLRGTSDIDAVGRMLSDVADCVLSDLWLRVEAEFVAAHGRLPGGRMAALALGKLGGREMTAGSDLDLVFLYDLEDAEVESDGPKPLEPGRYFARLSQRVINALTAPTGEGRLYEIDMRLRPSGQSGPIATSLSGFRRYQLEDAWTWEHMALTRARATAGDQRLGREAEAVLQEVLTRPRDADELLREVAAMRARIAREKPAKNPWQIKELRGGLIDLEFLAQYLQLRHAAESPKVLSPSTQLAFARLAEAGHLDGALADRLIEAARFLRRLQAALRLTVGASFDEDRTSAGLKQTLAEACREEDFETLKRRLLASSQEVLHIFRDLIETPAAALGKPEDSKQPESKEERKA